MYYKGLLLRGGKNCLQINNSLKFYYEIYPGNAIEIHGVTPGMNLAL